MGGIIEGEDGIVVGGEIEEGDEEAVLGLALKCLGGRNYGKVLQNDRFAVMRRNILRILEELDRVKSGLWGVGMRTAYVQKELVYVPSVRFGNDRRMYAVSTNVTIMRSKRMIVMGMRRKFWLRPLWLPDIAMLLTNC